MVAYGKNRVIGNEGDLPWRIPSDLKHFKLLTQNSTVIMGRKTWESLPEAFRPLPNRRNIVLSRNPDYDAPGAEVFSALDTAIKASQGPTFIMGGGATYIEALPYAKRIHATEVEAFPAGDVSFPMLDLKSWKAVEEGGIKQEPSDEHPFRIRVFERAVV